MDLKVIKPFDWAHKGTRIESFVKDQVIKTDDEDLIRVSTAEKWATKVRGSGEGKALPGPSENKSLSAPGENKGADGTQTSNDGAGDANSPDTNAQP